MFYKQITFKCMKIIHSICLSKMENIYKGAPFCGPRRQIYQGRWKIHKITFTSQSHLKKKKNSTPRALL